jgi:hypothetical protein
MADQPWHELPETVALVLRPLLADLADEMIEAVRTVPAYARPLEGDFGEGIRAGVREALRHFLDEIERGGTVARPDVYRQIGRGEMRAGRSLESLLSAYRIGARVAWRRFAAAGEAAGLEPHTLYLLAEAIFAYIDVLSAESAEGHALERSAAASEAELRRRRLVRMLVRLPVAEPDAVRAAAREAGWELPRSLAVLALGGRVSELRSRLAPEVLIETIGELTAAVVPDPDGPGRRRALERAVARSGVPAGLGTTVAWPEAALSFTRAQGALGLAGARAGAGLLAADDVAGELLLAADRALAAEFAAARLEPLRSLAPRARERMTVTLDAWLAEQGRLGAVAARLGVHPQTARYRITRLRELFGPALDDADERFWLALALRIGSPPAAAAK